MESEDHEDQKLRSRLENMERETDAISVTACPDLCRGAEIQLTGLLLINRQLLPVFFLDVLKLLMHGGLFLRGELCPRGLDV